MKRLSILIGTVLLLTLPTQAFAATEAISDAVNEALERSRVAVEASRDKSLEKIAVGAIPDFIRQALSTMLIRVTTKTSVVEQERSLAGRSACFRYDLFLMDKETEAVWAALEEAEAKGDFMAIVDYQEILSYWGNQKDELLAGGLNRKHINASWPIPLRSEIPEDPEDDIFYEEDDPFCYYHSSYTPPTESGYGCTVAEMDRILSALPPEKTDFRAAVQRERNALARTMEAVEAIRRASNGLGQLRMSIDAIVDGLRRSSSSSKDGMTKSSSSAAFAELKPPVQGCGKDIPDGIVNTTLRTPFSVHVQEWPVLRNFWDLSLNEGGNRELPEGLEVSDKGDLFSDIDLTPIRDTMRDFADEQAKGDSGIYAAAVDPGLALEDIFAGLRAATARLVKLGSSTDEGLPVFVRNLAYWLLRSCTDLTACDERLRTIIHYTFTPSCFAYGNGTYKEATCAQPQWKKCQYEALYPGLPIPEELGCN